MIQRQKYVDPLRVLVKAQYEGKIENEHKGTKMHHALDWIAVIPLYVHTMFPSLCVDIFFIFQDFKVTFKSYSFKYKHFDSA